MDGGGGSRRVGSRRRARGWSFFPTADRPLTEDGTGMGLTGRERDRGADTRHGHGQGAAVRGSVAELPVIISTPAADAAIDRQATGEPIPGGYPGEGCIHDCSTVTFGGRRVARRRAHGPPGTAIDAELGGDDARRVLCRDGDIDRGALRGSRPANRHGDLRRRRIGGQGRQCGPRPLCRLQRTTAVLEIGRARASGAAASSNPPAVDGRADRGRRSMRANPGRFQDRA